MKALTIHNPYSHLIVTPQEELPVFARKKYVENRTWAASYRGPLAIHAGVSLKWFRGTDWGPQRSTGKLTFEDFPGMTFGAIVGVVDLVECVHVRVLRDHATAGRGWGNLSAKQVEFLACHIHTEGPFCWVVKNAVRLTTPIKITGKQGLWNLPEDIVQEIERQTETLNVGGRSVT